MMKKEQDKKHERIEKIRKYGIKYQELYKKYINAKNEYNNAQECLKALDILIEKHFFHDERVKDKLGLEKMEAIYTVSMWEREMWEYEKELEDFEETNEGR